MKLWTNFPVFYKFSKPSFPGFPWKFSMEILQITGHPEDTIHYQATSGCQFKLEHVEGLRNYCQGTILLTLFTGLDLTNFLWKLQTRRNCWTKRYLRRKTWSGWHTGLPSEKVGFGESTCHTVENPQEKKTRVFFPEYQVGSWLRLKVSINTFTYFYNWISISNITQFMKKP